MSKAATKKRRRESDVPLQENAPLMTREQLEADIKFLAQRQKRTGGWYSDRDRDWGISSNSLVSYAYDVGKPEMPLDWSDYAACVRVARRMPRHRRTKQIMIALSIQKSAVMKRHSESERRSNSAERRQKAA